MWERMDRSGRRAWRFCLLVLVLSTVRVSNEGVAVAQSPPTETVQLAPGAAAVTESGLLDSRTHDDHGYVFRGEAGQVLEVQLRASNPDVSFDVAPVGEGSALVNSAISGEKHWTGRLPATGDYRVRVYLQRSAARRAVTARYFLSLALRATTPPAASALGGSTWQLVRVRSADDRTLVLRAGQREKYTLTFGNDGYLAVRADCHRVSGKWMSAGENQLSVTALSVSRAACESGPFSDRFLHDLSYVRSYSQRGGRLHLSLMADGGTYEFEPVAAAEPEAVKPSFDCQGTISAVEQRICENPRLAARDNQLANVYASAVRRSEGRPEPWLTRSQQAFVRRRDACGWSDDANLCLERVYDERIAEVQVKGGLVTARAPMTFTCADRRGKSERVTVTHHRSEPPSVTLERGSERVFAVAGPSGNGVRYEAPNVVFREKGEEAELSLWGAELRCTHR